MYTVWILEASLHICHRPPIRRYSNYFECDSIKTRSYYAYTFWKRKTLNGYWSSDYYTIT